jgi:hypothetical protein
VSAAATPVAADSRGRTGESGSMALRSLETLAPFLAAALACAVIASLVEPYPVGIFHDDGVYLILARSLASADGYRYLHLPGAPIATHYPPAYPILLALLLTVGGALPKSITILLLANAVLLGVATWALTQFMRRRLGWTPLAAAGIAVASTVSLPMVMLSTLVMSEVLFLAVCIPLLTMSERAVTAERRRARLFALGAMVGALALVRMQGVVLAAVVGCLLAVRQDWRKAAYLLAGAVLVTIPWQLWVAFHDRSIPPELRGSYGSYVGWFFDGLRTGGFRLLTGTISRNLSEATGLLADRFAPWRPGFGRIAGVVVAALFFLTGSVRFFRRAPVTLWFVVAYLALTLVWPYAPWRFIWGIWPLIIVIIACGVHACITWSPVAPIPRLVRVIPAAALAALVMGAIRAERAAYVSHAWSTPVREATARIAPEMRWLTDNARPHETVVADAEPLVYLFTRHRAVPPVPFTANEYVAARTLTADTAALSALVRYSAARYVLSVVPSTIAAARALMSASPNRGFVLREADSLSDGAVFEVVRP